MAGVVAEPSAAWQPFDRSLLQSREIGLRLDAGNAKNSPRSSVSGNDFVLPNLFLGTVRSPRRAGFDVFGNREKNDDDARLRTFKNV